MCDLYQQAQDTLKRWSASMPGMLCCGERPVVAKRQTQQRLNQSLAEMNGFDPRKGAIVLAAAKRQEVLDSAL
jgi:cell division protease FtsH